SAPDHGRREKCDNRGERERAHVWNRPRTGASAAAQVPARVGRLGQVIVAADGVFSHADAAELAARVRDGLRAARGDACTDLADARVAFLVPPSFAHVVISRGIWLAGGVAVPLAVSHPPAELEYVIGDSEASIVVGSGRQEDALRSIAHAAGAR